MPNWEGSDRRQTLPPDRPVRHLTVLRRDHHRCQHLREDTGRKCGRTAHNVDHIVSYKDGGTDDYSNLQALCERHHRQKSGPEGGRASGQVRRAKRNAAKPIHPGLIAFEPVEPQAPF
jgi:5-methylcytosine-specific restriction protein A